MDSMRKIFWLWNMYTMPLMASRSRSPSSFSSMSSYIHRPFSAASMLSVHWPFTIAYSHCRFCSSASSRLAYESHFFSHMRISVRVAVSAGSSGKTKVGISKAWPRLACCQGNPWTSFRHIPIVSCLSWWTNRPSLSHYSHICGPAVVPITIGSLLLLCAWTILWWLFF